MVQSTKARSPRVLKSFFESQSIPFLGAVHTPIPSIIPFRHASPHSITTPFSFMSCFFLRMEFDWAYTDLKNHTVNGERAKKKNIKPAHSPIQIISSILARFQFPLNISDKKKVVSLDPLPGLFPPGAGFTADSWCFPVSCQLWKISGALQSPGSDLWLVQDARWKGSAQWRFDGFTYPGRWWLEHDWIIFPYIGNVIITID